MLVKLALTKVQINDSILRLFHYDPQLMWNAIDFPVFIDRVL